MPFTCLRCEREAAGLDPGVTVHHRDCPQCEEALDSVSPTGPLPPPLASILGTAAKDRIALRALKQGHAIPGADWYALTRAGLVESERERWTSVGQPTEGKLSEQGKARLEELEELDH